jgi:amino acid permease
MNNIRPFGWVIIGINALLLINFFTAIDENMSDLSLVVGFFFTLFLMTVISIPLYIIYRITGKKGRVCPACGVKVPVGLTVCPKCLFDFRKMAGETKE